MFLEGIPYLMSLIKIYFAAKYIFVFLLTTLKTFPKLPFPMTPRFW